MRPGSEPGSHPAKISQPRALTRFLSIKWKALILTSLVLAAVTASYATLNYLEMRQQFAQRREELQSQYAVQVQGLLDQYNNRLEQLTAMVASLPGIEAAVNQPISDSDMRAVIDRLMAVLEMNFGVEKVALISSEGDQLISNGTAVDLHASTSLAESVRQAINSETPKSFIDCSDICLQYAVAPVLGAAGEVGALVLGMSLTDVILDFRRVSGTDLGLIVQQEAPEAPTQVDSDRWLGGWHAQVIVLSNAPRNLPLLRMLASKAPSLGALYAPRHFKYDGRQFEIRLFSLAGFGSREKAHLATISDISDSVAQIRTATQRSILLGVGGLMVSEIILLLTLWRPMSRLRRAAVTLPSLAEGAFSKVRSAISSTKPSQVFRDEVDVLNDTAIELAHQLEELNEEVAERTRDLSQRMREIMRERNFVTHVLDTAQAIILTQDRRNRIIMVNTYGQALTGYDMEDLDGRPFLSMLAPAGSIGIMERLVELVDGEREHLEAECDLFARDGSVINVFWHHSRLRGDDESSPVILSVGMDITARKKAELRLAWLADHDPLTALFNRRRFEQELEQAIASAKRYQHSGALLFFDLDQFKYVNDTSGHSAGDRLLKRLGESLPGLLREVDLLGRLGGDEFGVILSRSCPEEAVSVAKKILSHIQGMEFPEGERIHKVSASIGIAMFPEHSNDAQDLLARADLAMYQVKESGRGGWHLLSNDDQSQQLMYDHVLWKQRVERALSQQLFMLYVQPILRIKTMTVGHYEVLLRMRGDDETIISPSQFIEVAERSGLIHVVDRMVLSESILFLASARDRGQIITLTVNLSAHAFRDPDLLGHLERLLQENYLDPRQLIFEMTETAALADLTAARRLMEAINSIGCLFALDDFGTGFSSFYYLKQLPFEFIKIDGSFIRNLGERPDDQVLVKAMAEIATAFHKYTIAEQVEDAQTLVLLEEFGIDFAQGYFTGLPQDITTLFPDKTASLPNVINQ